MNLKIRTFPLLVLVVLFITSGCDKIGNNNPEWINKMTDSLETNDFYWGSKIYEHEWKSELYYHLEIPLSSCGFCCIYDENGISIDWQIEDMDDYLENRKRERVVWTWKKTDK